jgi:hypothetical protein
MWHDGGPAFVFPVDGTCRDGRILPAAAGANNRRTHAHVRRMGVIWRRRGLPVTDGLTGEEAGGAQERPVQGDVLPFAQRKLLAVLGLLAQDVVPAERQALDAVRGAALFGRMNAVAGGWVGGGHSGRSELMRDAGATRGATGPLTAR